MSEELKTCKTCKEQAKIMWMAGGCFVECFCGMFPFPPLQSRDELIEKWNAENERYPEPDRQEEKPPRLIAGCRYDVKPKTL